MGELEYELINNAIDTQSATDQFKFSVRGVVENKVMLIEMRELSPTNAASYLKEPSSVILHDSSQSSIGLQLVYGSHKALGPSCSQYAPWIDPRTHSTYALPKWSLGRNMGHTSSPSAG